MPGLAGFAAGLAALAPLEAVRSIGNCAVWEAYGGRTAALLGVVILCIVSWLVGCCCGGAFVGAPQMEKAEKIDEAHIEACPGCAFANDTPCSWCRSRPARVSCQRCTAPLCTNNSCAFKSATDGRWLCNFPNCRNGQYYEPVIQQVPLAGPWTRPPLPPPSGGGNEQRTGRVERATGAQRRPCKWCGQVADRRCPYCNCPLCLGCVRYVMALPVPVLTPPVEERGEPAPKGENQEKEKDTQRTEDQEEHVASELAREAGAAKERRKTREERGLQRPAPQKK